VILTGGDPLAVSNSILEKTLLAIRDRAPQIRSVRIHSRMAVTLPSRLDTSLAELLGRADWPFQIHLVSHFNHPRELTPLAQAGLKRLRRAGVALWNQSVLLRKINDRVQTLAELFQGLYETGVAPIYLHHPDWTPGTFGFRLPISHGRKIMQALAGKIPGPALPKYVLDLPQGWGKVNLLDHRCQVVQQNQAPESGGFEWSVWDLPGPSLQQALEVSSTDSPNAPGTNTFHYLDLSWTSNQNQ
jgi:lysine 2,3-aminomutase